VEIVNNLCRLSKHETCLLSAFILNFVAGSFRERVFTACPTVPRGDIDGIGFRSIDIESEFGGRSRSVWRVSSCNGNGSDHYCTLYPSFQPVPKAFSQLSTPSSNLLTFTIAYMASCNVSMYFFMKQNINSKNTLIHNG